jgi:hypothetical protein
MNNNIKKLFLKQESLIKIKAFQYWNKNKVIPFDDFISECHFIFLHCYEKYNPEKGSFKTFFTKALDNRLKNFIYREGNKYNQTATSNINSINDTYNIYFEDWKNELSSEAQKIIEIILYKPLKQIKSRKGTITKTSIKNFLKQNNWKNSLIFFCFNEIQTALKKV